MSFDKHGLKLSVICISFLIPLSQFLSVRLLFLTSIVSFYISVRNKSIFRIWREQWDLFSFMTISIGGLIYTSDLSTGFSSIETSFGVFAFPIIFCSVNSFEEKDFLNTLQGFTYGLLAASSICIINALISFINNGSPEVFFFYNLTKVLDFQPTYQAYYLCFGISILLYTIYYEKATYPNWILILIIIFFFLVLLLTAGKTAYVSILLVFSFFILKYLFSISYRTNATIVFGLSLFLLACLLTFNLFDLKITGESAENSDSWERLPLWTAALKANPNFLFGVGTGDYKLVLNNYFTTHGFDLYAKTNLNSHNQFIQTFFTNGFFGLLTIIFMLGRPLTLSVKHENALGVMTFFSFFIYGITEVFLGRYQGVVFFAFLHQCFIAYYNNNPRFSKNIDSRKFQTSGFLSTNENS